MISLSSHRRSPPSPFIVLLNPVVIHDRVVPDVSETTVLTMPSQRRTSDCRETVRDWPLSI